MIFATISWFVLMMIMLMWLWVFLAIALLSLWLVSGAVRMFVEKIIMIIGTKI